MIAGIGISRILAESGDGGGAVAVESGAIEEWGPAGAVESSSLGQSVGLGFGVDGRVVRGGSAGGWAAWSLCGRCGREGEGEEEEEEEK